MAAITRRPLTIYSAISLLLLCLFPFAASMGHCAEEGKVSTNSRKLVAAIPADLPPTYFLDKTGKPAGFAVEVMNQLALKTGLTVEYVSGEAFEDLIQMVLNGKADLIPSLTIDERRKELLAFTDTVGFLPANLFVASGNLTVQQISPGLTIGVLKGSAPETLLKKDQTIRVETFTNLQTMLFELLAGHIDGIVFLTPNLMKLAIDAGVEDKIKVVGKPIIEARRGIALRKDDTELLALLNKAIGAFIGSPEYQRIYVKWYGKPKPYWTAGRTVAASGIFLFLIVCGMAFWRYRSVVRLNTRLTLNITDREKAEELLRESESRFRELAEMLPAVVFETDTQGTLTFVNHKAFDRLGYTKEDFAGGLNALNMLKTDDHDRAMKNMLRIMNGEIAGSNEYTMQRKDGSSFPALIHSTAIVRDGKPAGLRGFIVDITDRKKAEEELREKTGRLHLATASAKAGVWDWNLRTNEMIWDDRMLELYGLSHENFPGGIKAWEQGLHPDDSARAIEECQAALRGEREFDTEFRVRHPDGTVVHIKASGFVLRDEEGKPLRMIGLNTDITDRKQAEAEKRELTDRLQRAEKMEALGQLAGGVAHDLNNVLGILSGYSELLLDEIPEGNKSRGHVEKILKSTKKGAAIIDDLLTLARRGVTSTDVINLSVIASDFMTTPSFENIKDYNPRVTFRADLEESLPNIKGSSVHLEKTLMNLVSNAAEAISGAGTVTIRTEGCYLEKAIRGYDEIKEGEYAVLTVSDTGSGIPADSLTKIFEPFYTKKKMGRSGTGLGLSIVWGTVKDHEGYIDIHTEEGKGTTFSLYFPVTEEKLAEPEAEVPIERYMSKGETVLVVDDRDGQREIASQLITKLGYQVDLASSGEAAVEYLKAQKADIIVLDMIMPPGMDGLDTYKKILEINPKQKAVIVSGFSANERVKEAQRLGAGAYVKKPYATERIGLALRRELDRK